jgi:hypothetical protein
MNEFMRMLPIYIVLFCIVYFVGACIYGQVKMRRAKVQQRLPPAKPEPF